jgi:hypothetical protein
MVRRNATLALVDVPPMHAAHGELAARVRRVEIDGRLHAWEWLLGDNGALIKADAHDHHASHDLIGCQDITWDLAGAVFELGLDAGEQQRLAAITDEVSGQPIDPDLLAFARPCYLAFQLGRHALAAGAGGDESARLQAAADRYAAQLASRE